jgi:hypothetical protein
MKEELTLIERNHAPKEKSLNQLKASLEAMHTTKEGLENELNQVSCYSVISAYLDNIENIFSILTIIIKNVSSYASHQKLRLYVTVVQIFSA